ncbi:adenylosuccinate lyase, partial [Helicobacter pylori]|nr:adenylosuccinate lyase [Helicobacter pylori]
VQENAMKIWEVLQQGAFKNADENLFLNALLNDERLKKYLSEDEIKACFDYSYYTKNVGAIFKRVFG